MFAFLAATILAASLSSSDIGEFFTLPSWLPSSVASANTPGSDPDWYVDEYTNGVVLANTWACEYAGTVFNQAKSISYVGNDLWDITSVTAEAVDWLHPGWTLFDPGEYYVLAGEDAEYIAYTTTASCDGDDGVRHDIELSLECVRNKSEGLIRTGRKVPRAARLTPSVQAGILSTFAAYCERQYYASQGQSNGWDEAEWGPTDSKRRFVFAPNAAHHVEITSNWWWNVSSDAVPDFGYGLSYRSGSGWNVYPLCRFGFMVKLGGYSWNSMIQPSSGYLPGDASDTNVSGTVSFSYWPTRGSETTVTNISFFARKYLESVTTNEYWTGYDEWFYTPTNRIITSRRLVQYDNIDALADFLLSGHMSRGFMHTAPARPGWICGGIDSSRMWWGTTAGPIFDTDSIVPSMNWATDPFAAYSNAWATCSRTFECLSSDPVWANSWHPDRVSPGERMMKSVYVGDDDGETAFEGEVETYCTPPLVAQTMSNQLALVYSSSTPYAITNETRRLVPDRIATENQMLGLMDRTFHVPVVSYDKGTERSYYTSEVHDDGGEVQNVTGVVYNVYTGVYTVMCDGSIAWDGLSSPTYGETYHLDTTTDVDRITHFITATSTSADISGVAYDGTVGLVKPGKYAIEDLFYDTHKIGTWEVFMRQAENATSSDPDFIYYEIIANRIDEPDYINNVGLFGLSGGYRFADFSCVYGYSREYSFHRANSPRLGVTQPGWEGDVVSSQYGEVTSLRQTRMSATSGVNTVTFKYNSKSGGYSGRSGIEAVVANERDYIRRVVNTEYGHNPTNCELVIPISVSDAMRVRNSAAITNIYVAMQPYECNVVTGTWNNGTFDVESCGCYSIIQGTMERGEYKGDRWAVLSRPAVTGYDGGCAAPSQQETDSFRYESKIGLITRTDWDWKALKRNDN